jgi:hypothetical protein
MKTTAPPQPRKFGCWFYGCTTVSIFLVAGLILLYLLTRYALHTVDKLVQTYTDTNAVPIERVELPPAEWTNLQQRVETFGQALEKAGPPAELALSARELNALIANSPKYKELRDRVQVMITNGTVGGKISYPLQDIGPVKLQGRYLNGTATFTIGLQDGRLDVRVKEMEVKGEPVPAPFLRKLREANLAEQAQADPETTATLRKFESIQVQDGKVILKSKGQSPSSP